ncbi:MAG TPA: preprotein translocase subunit YajC [Dehalococcoidales bacterium]|nr:preprotein translocase subunit YajC [Dehalococcoidales bacterium]
MNKILKTGLIAGLLIAVLVFFGGCLAPAAGDGEGTTGSIWPMIIFLVVIFALFYFVMIRPQRKRQKEHQTMMQELQKGDRVVTAGGIYGTIESLSEESVVIKVESGGTLRVARGSVAVRREDIRK